MVKRRRVEQARPLKGKDEEDALLGDDDWEDESGGSDVSSEGEEEVKETEAEARLRLEKEYLARLAAIERKGDEGGVDDEEEEGDGVHDAVAKRLHEEVLASKGALFRIYSDKFQDYDLGSNVRSYRGHKGATTAVALTPDETTCFSGSKDCSLLKWDVETGKKSLFGLRKKFWRASTASSAAKGKPTPASRPKGFHNDHILALATSDDGKLMASGGRDRYIRIWDVRSGENIHVFKGHMAAVTGLKFRPGTNTLLSCGLDRTMRTWDAENGLFLETFYGHESDALGVDAFNRERGITCGADRTARLVKIPEQSQLVFRGTDRMEVLECVSVLTEHFFVTGAHDGSLASWYIQKKKPVQIIPNAHAAEGSQGCPWVLSVASFHNSDVFASSGGDGVVRFWQLTKGSKEERRVLPIGNAPVPGLVNSIGFGRKGRVLACAVGQEPRMGKWYKHKVKNGVTFVDLPGLDEPSLE